jgi:hypothetical protein
MGLYRAWLLDQLRQAGWKSHLSLDWLFVMTLLEGVSFAFPDVYAVHKNLSEEMYTVHKKP